MKRISLVIGLFVASPAFALDECLIGTWHVDTADFAHVLSTQMGGTASYVSGSVRLDFAKEGDFSLTVRGLVMNFERAALPALDVTFEGYSKGTIDTGNDAWEVYAQASNLTGSAEVSGQRQELPIELGASVFSRDEGVYGCSDETLWFTSDTDGPRLPHRWERVLP